MEFEFNINLGMDIARKKALQILNLATEMTVSKAKQNIQQNFEHTSGNLEKQTYGYVEEDNLRGLVISNTPYSRIREMGGDILPVNARALAIPVHPDARKTAIPQGKSIRDIFPDLVLIKSKSGHPLLVRSAGRGFNHGRMDIMYVLVTKVHQKAKPYLRPAGYEMVPKAIRKFKVS